MTRTLAVFAVLALSPCVAQGQSSRGPAGSAEQPEPAYADYYDNLRVLTGNTPSLRLEQDASAGQTPHAWELQTFFSGYFGLKDASANMFPIMVAPSTGSGTLAITPAGLGVGIMPTARLDVYSEDAGTTLPRAIIQEGSATSASRNMLRIVNRGASTFRFDNSATGAFWGFGSLGNGNFFVGSSAGQPLAFTLTPGGNVTLTGTLVQMSDRNAKHDVVPVDAEDVLGRVAALPLSRWSYNGDDARHIGPMAQDFAAAFQLGDDDKHLAPADLAGVSLAAVQALEHKLLAQQRREALKDAELQALRARLDALEKRLPALAEDVAD